MVAADEDGLRLVELPRVPAGVAGSRAQSQAQKGSSDLSLRQGAALERWVEALEEYFRGERLAWSTQDIPWEDLRVRPFERAVYEALLTVGPGETVSYGHLAEMAGHPRAARAVGSAMAANPIPVVIPCHRVIRSDGTLGNYGDDPDWKPRLLEHERSTLKTWTSR
jgi:methylated-DNA-[protein]-cysteine S-methyltransferase